MNFTLKFISLSTTDGGTRRRSWMKYCPTRSRGSDYRCYHWNFSLTQSFWPHYGSGFDSASNISEYQEYLHGGKGGRCVGMTTLPPSRADCLETWDHQPPGALRPVQACTSFVVPLLLNKHVLSRL
jgi:hypothetical protein